MFLPEKAEFTMEFGGPQGTIQVRVYYLAGVYAYYLTNSFTGKSMAGRAKTLAELETKLQQRLATLVKGTPPVVALPRQNGPDRGCRSNGMIDEHGRFLTPRRGIRDPRVQQVAQASRQPRVFDELEKRYEEFHSHPVEEVHTLDIDHLLPTHLSRVGTGDFVMYRTRKDDPLTRADRKKKGLGADPEGPAGFPKDFIHRHDHSHGGIYSVSGGPEVWGVGPIVKGAAKGPSRRFHWPQGVYFLGQWTGVRFTDAAGKVHEYRPTPGWDLWAYPDPDRLQSDAHVLFAVPAEQLRQAHEHGSKINNLLLWRGGNLVVTYHGIGG